jgi:hypothetical protein
MDHPRPNLRYVDADDLETNTIKFDGLEVDSTNGEKLGKLEGFIIDVVSGRPYHVVVGSGGWMRHKHFLLPVGHVALSPNNDKMIASVPRDRVERYPGFDKDEFEKLSDSDLKRMTDTMSAECCPDEVVSAGVSEWDTSHYAYPTWWEADYYRPDRADRAAMDVGGATTMAGAGIGSYVATDTRTDIDIRDTPSTRNDTRETTRTRDESREEVTASENAGDTSPHLGGRAQPGDVLGVETGGERTYVGDTSEDENKRRRDAEKAARKNTD